MEVSTIEAALPNTVLRYKGELYIVDDHGRLAIPEPRRVNNRPRVARVDLPKLRKAIKTSGHAETNKALDSSQYEEITLFELWKTGWRPSLNGTRVLDSNKNPYIK
jgi:hypothetical protein